MVKPTQKKPKPNYHKSLKPRLIFPEDMIDIVRPQNNEKAFLSLAAQLGYSAICFAYVDITKDIRRKLSQIKTEMRIYAASVKPSRTPLNIVFGKFNPRTDVFFDAEPTGGRDYSRERNTLLTPDKIAHMQEEHIMLGFSLYHLLHTKDRAKHIGRVEQNIVAARRAKIEMSIASLARKPYEMRAPLDIRGLFTVFGMRPGEAKSSTTSVEKRILHNMGSEGRGVAGVEWD